MCEEGIGRVIEDAVHDAIRAEHKRLRTILGFDVEKQKEIEGHTVTVSYDPYYDLEGAVIDLERQNADKACIRTIRRHQARLIAFDRATKNSEGTPEEMGQRFIEAWHRAEDDA